MCIVLDLGVVLTEYIFTFTFWASLVAQPAILGLGRSPRKGSGYPLQYTCLENSMDRGAWWAIIDGVTKESDMTERLTHFQDWGPT